ncbi:hypothetical protein N7495_001744 [Penicillium taxi]|uniref:uncharacterized protein n=1 Tax=Penicillium taxi TaxID=168475 RepID=UPI002545060F|nr:uncharacterized protein N7495_001744 [Penicillium taxi]KAJ5909062.1 hypothetical protein N7495_001744 [Penicillium taxi]
MRKLRRNGNQINIRWISKSEDNKLLGLAKEQARVATQEDALLQERVPRMKSTTLNIARSQAVPSNDLPVNVGRHAKRVDAALPGKHTQQLYDRLSWKEASVPAQLRTGMARLNGYLYGINVADTDQCASHRTELLQCTNTHRGNISFSPGGKSPSDDQKWTPNLRRSGPQYDSPWPWADSRPPNHADELKFPSLFTDLIHQPPRFSDGRRASTAEDRMLNTWRSAFKPAY